MKNSAKTPKIIQFMHPGKEHSYASGDTFKSKNNKQHERNFICADGSYIDDSGNKVDDALCFWGEWENAANAKPIGSNKQIQQGLPHHLITPVPVAPTERAENTDPFVFGSNFKYFCCRQPKYKSLKELNRGDIILFGSRTNFRFLIDTVFVVADKISYKAGDYEEARKMLGNDFEPFFSNSFCTMTVPNYGKKCKTGSISCNTPVRTCGKADSYTLYIGATPENHVDGMFSFAPAKPLNSCPNGFARPEISAKVVNGISSYKLRSIKKINSTNIVQDWKNICTAVQTTGCVLGVHFELK